MASAPATNGTQPKENWDPPHQPRLNGERRRRPNRRRHGRAPPAFIAGLLPSTARRRSDRSLLGEHGAACLSAANIEALHQERMDRSNNSCASFGCYRGRWASSTSCSCPRAACALFRTGPNSLHARNIKIQLQCSVTWAMVGSSFTHRI
jgi:hypothetical protein